MRVVRPPAAARQSRRPSSSPRSASVEDMNGNDDDVDDSGSGLWQREQQNPIVVIVVVDDCNDVDNDRIVEAGEQLGGTANPPIGSSATTAAVFLDLVLVGIILSGISVIVGIIGIIRIIPLSRRASTRHHIVKFLIRRRCCRWSSQPPLPPSPLPQSYR